MTERTLEAWLNHLETLHPKAIDLGLERTLRVAQTLEVAPKTAKTLIFAGTNGKGSAIATAEALLTASGQRVGVYTSPHLIDFNERIKLCGQFACDLDILRAFDAIERARGSTTLSYFEFATLAALWLFEEENVDWQLLEVGLGGRLDAVNILDADACIITSIGLDHVEWLGDTRDLIAPEKAGVARAGAPAVVAESDLPSTLLPALEDRGAQPLVMGRDWFLEGDRLELPDGQTRTVPAVAGLKASNLSGAVVLLDSVGALPEQEDIDRSLATLVVPGRQQRLNIDNRELWFDVAHNREAVELLASALEAFPPTGQTHAVFGAMADKPLRDMISHSGRVIDFWHLPRASDVARAAKPEQVAEFVTEGRYQIYPDAIAATRGVFAATKPGDRVVVFGSFITVGAQLANLNLEQTVE